MTTTRNLLAALAVLLAFAAPAAAKDDPLKRDPAVGRPDKDQKTRQRDEASEKLGRDLQRLHAGNRAEILFGQIAVEQATDPEVRRLARRLVRDHRQMDQELREVARDRGIELEGRTFTTELDKLKDENRALKDKKGADFDREYSMRMEREHDLHVNEKLPDMIENARTAGENRVVALLEKAKTTLESHLDHAQKAADKAAGSGSDRPAAEGEKSKRFEDLDRYDDRR